MFDLGAFLRELVVRFFTDKPQFFKILQYLMTGLSLLIFVVGNVLPNYGIVVSAWVVTYANYIIGILVAIGVGAQLPMNQGDKEAKGIG